MTELDWASVVIGADDGYLIGDPVSFAELSHAESTLATQLPELLRELYLTTDGIFDAPGQWHVVWLSLPGES